MATKILTISIKPEHDKFLSETNLSPSKLLQEKIEEEQKKMDLFLKSEIAWQRKIEGYQELCVRHIRFLDFIGKHGDFQKWSEEHGANQLV